MRGSFSRAFFFPNNSAEPVIREFRNLCGNPVYKTDGTVHTVVRASTKGIKGKEIPIEGRIAALADVFDVITTKRPYKEAFPEDKAFKIIEAGKGTHFDPELVDAFFEGKDKILQIKQEYKDNGRSILFELAEPGS